MQVRRGTDNYGVNVIGGSDGIKIADLSAVLLRHKGGGRFKRIKHGFGMACSLPPTA